MLKKLAAYVQQYRTPAILTPVCMIGEVFMEMLIPYIMAALIDQGINQGSVAVSAKYGVIMLLCAMVSLLFGIGGGRFGARASAGFAANLRRGMYENIQSFSFANIDKFSTAGLVTRLTTDVTNVQNAFQMILRIAVRAPLTLITALVMCFVTNQRLSLIFLAAVVFLSVCLALIVKAATRRFSVVFERYDDLNASVQENVSAIRVVKAFVREDHEKSKFNAAVDRLYQLFVRAEKVVILNGPVMMLTVYACIILLSWLITVKRCNVKNNAVDSHYRETERRFAADVGVCSRCSRRQETHTVDIFYCLCVYDISTAIVQEFVLCRQRKHYHNKCQYCYYLFHNLLNL